MPLIDDDALKTATATATATERDIDVFRLRRTIGSSIRLARHNDGMSQDDLAAAAGIAKSFLSDLENGKRTPSAETLLRLSKAQDCPIAWYFGDMI
jgi:ribosome-binding protein aMBF1 (putative translation factor)